MIDQIECYVLLPPERSGREEMLRAAQDLEGQGQWEDAMRIRIEVSASWPRTESLEASMRALRLRVPWPIYGQLPGQRGLMLACAQPIGRRISIDGCDCRGLATDDAKNILGYGQTSNLDGMGEVAGIARLEDGRFVAWEIAGGDADVGFARTAGACLGRLTARSREILRWG